MPIKGLSDQGASFPRIGELRKGAPKQEGSNRPGSDLDHFRFTSKDPEAAQAFKAAYGDEPQSINVFLPFNTTDENFESWVECWGSGSLKWRGDGETLVIWQKDDGTYSKEPRPQPPTGGKEIGRLKVIIPELRRLAYVVALTSSIHDIMELSANLRAYEALRGSLQGIPFVLSRVPRMVSTPMKDKRVRVEKWLLHLEAAPQWVQSQLSVMKRQALPGASDLPALEAGDMIDVETGEILDGDDGVLEGEVVEFDDLQSASEPASNGDSRAETSPQKQAKREQHRPSRPAQTNGNGADVDHLEAARNADTFQKFAYHASQALDGFDGPEHIVGAIMNKLYPNNFMFDKNKTNEYLNRLADYKAETA